MTECFQVALVALPARDRRDLSQPLCLWTYALMDNYDMHHATVCKCPSYSDTPRYSLCDSILSLTRASRSYARDPVHFSLRVLTLSVECCMHAALLFTPDSSPISPTPARPHALSSVLHILSCLDSPNLIQCAICLYIRPPTSLARTLLFQHHAGPVTAYYTVVVAPHMPKHLTLYASALYTSPSRSTVYRRLAYPSVARPSS